ncbi:MAG: autotransporter-associated beta strand repeat-containing protein [Opitutus sp.]
MKVRFSLLALAVVSIAAATAHAQVLWSATLNGSLNNVLNWTGGVPTNADLVFSTTLQPVVAVNSSISVRSLKFSGIYPTYTFSTPNGSMLTIGPGGIIVEAEPPSEVQFAAALPLALSISQIWAVDGDLTVSGTVSNTGASAIVLTKTGAGSLVLNGSNTFNGGTVLQSGTLLIGSSSVVNSGAITSSAVGIGPLTLVNNTTFGATRAGLTLHNDISVATGVTLISGSESATGAGLVLGGRVTAATNNVAVQLSAISPLSFTGVLDGPANSAVRFVGTSTTGIDGAILSGTTSATVTSLIADRTAIYFASAASLPATLNVGALNGGYVGVTASSVPTVLPASTLLNRIATPAAFAGTFGFDTTAGTIAPYVYDEDLDFRGFTDPAFNLGSRTEAVLSGSITPPNNGSTALYRFGSGGGHLFVQSNLTNPTNAVTGLPVSAAVVVMSTISGKAEEVVFQGSNTYSGTTTTGGVTSNLRVDDALVVLDSAQALPTGASFSLGAHAYVGYTEAAGFPSFADFLGHLTPGGYSATSVLGLDSHAFLQDKLTSGNASNSGAQRVFSGLVDLSGLNDIFLGSLTRVRVSGEVRAPSSHILQLTGVNDGHLTISSVLAPTTQGGAPNITSVTVGYPNGAGLDKLGAGEVELTGANTYTGGTNLKSGALIVGNSSTVSGSTITASPVGTGSLNVANSTTPVLLASNSATGATLYNPVVLSGPLQLGLVDAATATAQNNSDTNLLILRGDISGTGGLDIYGRVILSGTNTFLGGTYAHTGGVVFDTTASIPGLLTAVLQSDVNGYIGLASMPTLTLQASYIGRFDPVNTHGTIGFDTLDASTTVFSGAISLAAFTSSTVRLGTGTSAKITGPITPAGTTYRFGGGGGFLEVASNLIGLGYDLEASSASGASLALRLTGTNTYSGSTTARNSAVIFAAGSIPNTNTFVMDSSGYIGTEDSAFDSNFNGFLGHFAAGLDGGIIGFDTDPAAPGRTITSTLNLSRFTSVTPNFYLGTSSGLTFGAGSSIVLPTNASAYRFAGYRGGRLQIDTVLSGSKAVVIGDPASQLTQVSPLGIVSSVVLNAANTFSGGTTFYAGNLYLGTSTVEAGGAIVSGPMGIGPLTVEPNQFGLRPALRALSGPITLANSIVLHSGLDISSDFTLNGVISGSSSLRKIDAGTLTLNGINAAWTGGLSINQGSVTLGSNTATGTGALRLGSALPTIATFTTAAPAIGLLSGSNSGNQLILADNSALTITQSGNSQFSGVISGLGASVTVLGADPATHQLTLAGANGYTGGTTIGPGAAVIAANNNALGTVGTVTVNQGTLAVASGITTSFNGGSHPLVIANGTIGGAGTLRFDTPLDVRSGTNGGVVLSPGFKQPGQLNFNFTGGATLILNSGGTYNWKLMDAANLSGGSDTITVAGSVNIAATQVAPFNFRISSVGSDGNSGEAASFDVYSSYSWTLIAADSIVGFNALSFTVDPSAFVNRTFDGSFSVGLDGTGKNLMLNYTAAAIPEPSTWALMLTGAAALAVASRRRRR